MKLLYVLSTLLLLSACGDSNPITESNSDQPPRPVDTTEMGCYPEVSDVDCWEESVSFYDAEDIAAFCQLGCSTFGRMELFQLSGVISIDGFSNLGQIKSLEVETPYDLRTVEGFENLIEVRDHIHITTREGPLESFGGFGSVEMVGDMWVRNNLNLESFTALGNLENVSGRTPGHHQWRNQALSFDDNPKLVEINDFPHLELVPVIRMLNNESLVTPPDFPSVREVNTIAIGDHPQLERLPDFSSLRRIHQTLMVTNSPNIRQCEVDALLAQLDEAPETIQVYGLSDEPCDD